MKFYCKKCGYPQSDLNLLVNNSCSKGGRCEPYVGHETGPYHCKKCGYPQSNLNLLVNSCCSKGGMCEPIE